MHVGKIMQQEAKLGYEDASARFERFLRAHYHEEIMRVVRAYPETRSLAVDFEKLDRFDASLADLLLNNPDLAISAAQRAVKSIEPPVDLDIGLRPASSDFLPAKISVRFQNLPATSRLLIRDIRNEHIGKLLSIEGIVRKSTDVRPKLVTGAFECPRCGHIHKIDQEGESMREPFACESCERKGPFKLLVQESIFTDAQKIMIQESLEDLRGGEHPKQLTIFLEDDLTGKIKPGDTIEVVGVLRTAQKKIKDQRSRVLEISLDANSFKLTEIDFEEVKISKEDEKLIQELSRDPQIYEKIRDSIAPHIYGNKEIKEAIMYQLFSSPPIQLPDGGRIRGDSHIILLGEPAVGKCITGDSKIKLGDGSVVEIEKFADQIFENEKPLETADGRQYIALNNRVYVLSMNDSLKIQKEKVTHVWRRKYSGKLLTISTLSGARIKVTPEHPFFIINSGKVISIPANKLRIGEFIAVPRILPVDGSPQKLSIDVTRSAPKNAVHITIPEQTSPELARLLGYLIAEGSLNEGSNGHSKALRFSNTDAKLIEDFVAVSEKLFGIKAKRYEREVQLTSVEVADFIEKSGSTILRESSKRELPEFVFKCTNNEIANLLRAFFDDEGYINKKQRIIEVSSTSFRLLEQLRYLLLRFGIISILRSTWKRATNTKSVKKEYFVLRICGLENLIRFSENIGFLGAEKSQRLKNLIIDKSAHNNIDVIPSIGSLLRATRRMSGLTKYFDLATAANFREYEIGRRNPSRTKLSEYCSLLADGGAYEIETYQDNLKKMLLLSQSDIFWDRIVSIGEEQTRNEYVYDLTVEHSHNFIANGIIIHNSEILQYVTKELAPRGVYASGKGTSGAGLTAAALKDEFGDGGWTLEAGALVLADKGLAAIDEFDKMEPTDRAAMHEAMEQQTVSIAKAGIIATFRARCSILAAANPKFGRFDDYKPISEQVNLPPTILSRFDLIFFVHDDLSKTRAVAKHILDTVAAPETTLEPKIKTDILRKYISYARQNVFPVLNGEARKRVEDFYVQMRESAQKAEGSPIPLTARQLWAIIRIARAASRVRLSSETTLEDVEHAIGLITFSLKQAGFDVEKGVVDVDKIMVGVTKSQRDRLSHVLALIREIEKESERGRAGKSEIIERAVKEGLSQSEVENTIEKLKKEGLIYDPYRNEEYKVV